MEYVYNDGFKIWFLISFFKIGLQFIVFSPRLSWISLDLSSFQCLVKYFLFIIILFYTWYLFFCEHIATVDICCGRVGTRFWNCFKHYLHIEVSETLGRLNSNVVFFLSDIRGRSVTISFSWGRSPSAWGTRGTWVRLAIQHLIQVPTREHRCDNGI